MFRRRVGGLGCRCQQGPKGDDSKLQHQTAAC